MNIKQEIETLKEKIAELEKEVEKVQEKKYPADGTTVYFLNCGGEVESHVWGRRVSEETMKRVKLLFDSGEFFLTEQDAEEYAEVKQTERELFTLADDDKGWDGFNEHHALMYRCPIEDVACTTVCNYKEPIPYFASEESAKNAIETVGEERVIKWLTYQRKRPQI